MPSQLPPELEKLGLNTFDVGNRIAIPVVLVLMS